MRKISKRILSASLGLVIGTGVLGQNPPEPQTYDLQIPVDLVLVPVTVEDKDGSLIHGLKNEDFEILEEGMLQRITYFSTDPSPLSVAFLVDRTLDARTQDIFKQSMLSLIEAFSDFDEMAFYEFLNATKKDQDFTSKKEDLLKPIMKVEFVPVKIDVSTTLSYAPMVNTSQLDNAISTAAYDLKKRGNNRRKIIFVVSNGITSGVERNTYDETKKLLLQNGIVVYGIGHGNSLLFRKVDPLKKYTGPTGGATFYPLKTGSFSETYQKVSQMARNQYVLGYVPQNRPNQEMFRRINVRITNERISVGAIRSRKGYYYIPGSKSDE